MKWLTDEFVNACTIEIYRAHLIEFLVRSKFHGWLIDFNIRPLISEKGFGALFIIYSSFLLNTSKFCENYHYLLIIYIIKFWCEFYMYSL